MFKLEVRDGIELRLVTVERARELTAIVLSNFEHLRPWLPWVNPNYSLDSAANFIRMGVEGFRNKNSLQTWIIENDEIIGGIGFNKIDGQNKSVEIGYWLTANACGRGVITDACSALIRHAFENLGIHRIVIRCASENTRSQAVPQRLGFVHEGVMRDAEWLHGRFVDLEVFSQLSDSAGIAD